MCFLRPTWSPPPKVLWSSVLGSGSFNLAPAHRWGHTGLLDGRRIPRGAWANVPTPLHRPEIPTLKLWGQHPGPSLPSPIPML